MTKKINFFTEDLAFSPKNKTILKKWIITTIEAHQQQTGELNFVFCSDAYLHQLNVQHLGHDTLTDIITFDNGDQLGVVEGDIFISVDRVRENASTFGVLFDQELHRVMIHGTLHLLGFGDKTADEQQLMRLKEDEQIQQLADLLNIPKSAALE